MKFHENLIALRRREGWSQEELGNRIGVTRQTVSKWELGLTTPELEKLVQLADVFGMTTDQLVGRTAATVPQEPVARPDPVVYEYISPRRLWGLPLVHIKLGRGRCRAKGILAIGNVATGILSIGMVSCGVVALGSVSLGVLALGAVAVGLCGALGGAAMGFFAMGGIALGIVSFGGLAAGVYAMGGGAAAVRVAAGGIASAPVAIGHTASGELTLRLPAAGAASQIRATILQKYPDTWELLLWLFSWVAYEAIP